MPLRVLAIDIGGAAIKSGVVEVSKSGAVIECEMPPVSIIQRRFDALKAAVIDVVAEGLRDAAMSDIAIATTGTVTPGGIVVKAGVYEGYEHISWARILKSRFRQKIRRVKVLNDGIAATLAEFNGRKEKKIHDMLHVVVGTGIGGGVIINGRLLRGASGIAGAIGHVKVVAMDGIQCVCGSTGCVQMYAAGPSILRYAQEGMVAVKCGSARPNDEKELDLMKCWRSVNGRR